MVSSRQFYYIAGCDRRHRVWTVNEPVARHRIFFRQGQALLAAAAHVDFQLFQLQQQCFLVIAERIL